MKSRQLSDVLPEVDDLRKFLAEVEKTLILRTLKSTNGAQAEAARRLGISRSDLGYKIAKYGISEPKSVSHAIARGTLCSRWKRPHHCRQIFVLPSAPRG